MSMPASRFIAAVALTAGISACGDSSSTTQESARDRVCEQPIQEPLDPRSAQHVIDDTPITYTSDPPTSGPHRPSAVPPGVTPDPLTNPVQVAVLERGDVLVQYKGQLSPELHQLYPNVVVAPNPTLSSRVIATSWRWKMICSSPNRSELMAFVKEHAGQGQHK